MAGVRIVFALAIVAFVGCAGKSSSFDDEPSAGGGAGEGGSAGVTGGSGSTTGGSGGTALGGDGGTGISGSATTGGSAGTTTGGSAGTTAGGSSSGGAAGTSDENCDDERRELRQFIAENKSCTDTADCRSTLIGCGITEDGCTGAVYTSSSADPVEFESRRERFQTCLFTYETTEGCATCDRVPTPPECRDGLCVGATACALEANAIWDFKQRNDGCEVDEDCFAEQIGCEVTEDDCTGAVYFPKTVDREELTLLRDEYWACTGGCGACRRALSPPACLQGHCVRGP
jgi:hypothetical protein